MTTTKAQAYCSEGHHLRWEYVPGTERIRTRPACLCGPHAPSESDLHSDDGAVMYAPDGQILIMSTN